MKMLFIVVSNIEHPDLQQSEVTKQVLKNGKFRVGKTSFKRENYLYMYNLCAISTSPIMILRC